MPEQKSKTKKPAAKTKKPAAKKSTAKKPAAKRAVKKTTVKKPSVKKTAKKAAVKKSVVSSKSAEAKTPPMVSDASLFIMSFADKPGNAETANTGETKESLPAVDLDQLAQGSKTISVRSRFAFYLGVFFGAVVVNALLVTVLASMSI